ncbi:hypothetical protein [Pseudomonas sp. p99-361]|uniref:hypothetical protein n=1 Tax=Pseudomonas sp. p99-361 TaxID=2479852 RepID=UPI000F79E5D2|nr:hypothetical protein [Pseudomonas sp. p99-361]
MKEVIYNFQDDLGGLFRELILGLAAHEIGIGFMRGSPNNHVSVQLAHGAVSEPVSITALIEKEATVRRGAVELFQNKAIARWSDLLSALYREAVGKHLRRERNFSALKSVRVKYDFGSAIDLVSQIQDSIGHDFDFSDYKTRAAAVKDIFGFEEVGGELAMIKKHVEIRNAIQHHGGRVHEGALRILGLGALDVVNENGDRVKLSLGDSIDISVMEVDLLKSALYVVSNYMEAKCED